MRRMELFTFRAKIVMAFLKHQHMPSLRHFLYSMLDKPRSFHTIFETCMGICSSTVLVRHFTQNSLVSSCSDLSNNTVGVLFYTRSRLLPSSISSSVVGLYIYLPLALTNRSVFCCFLRDFAGTIPFRSIRHQELSLIVIPPSRSTYCHILVALLPPTTRARSGSLFLETLQASRSLVSYRGNSLFALRLLSKANSL